MREHFDGVAFSFDKDKETLIDNLADASSFSDTHGIISSLETYSYFSLKEVDRILEAALNNGQFGGIVTDWDVSDFLNRVAIPRRAEINRTEFIDILDRVAEHQVQLRAE